MKYVTTPSVARLIAIWSTLWVPAVSGWPLVVWATTATTTITNTTVTEAPYTATAVQAHQVTQAPYTTTAVQAHQVTQAPYTTTAVQAHQHSPNHSDKGLQPRIMKALKNEGIQRNLSRGGREAKQIPPTEKRGKETANEITNAGNGSDTATENNRNYNRRNNKTESGMMEDEADVGRRMGNVTRVSDGADDDATDVGRGGNNNDDDYYYYGLDDDYLNVTVAGAGADWGENATIVTTIHHKIHQIQMIKVGVLCTVISIIILSTCKMLMQVFAQYAGREKPNM